jgi:hypothetical protein
MLFEEEFTKPSPEIERKKRGTGRFIMVRFRNKADLDKLADLLDEPWLKGVKKGSTTKMKWSVDKSVSDPLSSFME